MEIDGLEAARPAQRKTALRTSFRKMGERHHQKYKRLKFLQTAYRRYGLRRRSKKYEEYKKSKGRNSKGKRATGEVLPFVFTGESRRTTMAGNRVIVRKVSEAGTCECEVRLNARVLNFTPWLREEFERVNSQELRAQQSYGLRQYEIKLRQLRRRRKRKRRRRRRA